ncbi:hypothetical protein BVX95_00860 [archaeon D22]|nr:hypothetical protein BVX95_00860 [archaeon D22]
MVLIYETENYIVESHEKPFVSRIDGGHIRIKVKDTSITDRTKLTQKQAIELMRLTIVVGDSLEKGMNKQNIPVVKINYEDLGNWAFKRNESPYLHIHVFGRSKDAKKQVFPEAVYLPDRSSGFYDDFEPLNDEDIKIIKYLIESSFQTDENSDASWGLS